MHTVLDGLVVDRERQAVTHLCSTPMPRQKRSQFTDPERLRE